MLACIVQVASSIIVCQPVSLKIKFSAELCCETPLEADSVARWDAERYRL